MKRYFVVVPLIIGLVFLAQIRTDGFTLSKIFSNFSFKPDWDLPSPNREDLEEITKILDQKFFYLNKGRQCFVFESEDQKYVIKFFNHDRFRLPLWVICLPLPYNFDQMRLGKLQEKKERIAFSYKSYKIAYQELKKETGMIYLQLNRKPFFSKPLKIVDKVGREHAVDLKEVEFLIQKKAKMIYPALANFHAQGEEAFKKALLSFLDVIIKRCQKKIIDDDLDVEINFGFIKDQAILVDMGRLYLDPKLENSKIFRKELLKSTKYFRRWLATNYPEMKDFFHKGIENSINLHEESLEDSQ